MTDDWIRLIGRPRRAAAWPGSAPAGPAEPAEPAEPAPRRGKIPAGPRGPAVQPPGDFIRAIGRVHRRRNIVM
jgi:hypothetical protein